MLFSKMILLYYNLLALFYNRAGHKIWTVFCGWMFTENSPREDMQKKMETGDHSLYCPFTVVLFSTFTPLYLWRQHRRLAFWDFFAVFNCHFFTHLTGNPTGENLWDSLHPATAFQHHLEEINVCDFSHALGICSPVGSFPR